VHRSRALLVPRLLFTALISDDALVGMGHDMLSPLSCRLEALTRLSLEGSESKRGCG
jgi:hypothetical protein